MDKVEYNTLIELAREAQQGTGLEQQRASLNQFMDKRPFVLAEASGPRYFSGSFARHRPISLNDPMAAYEAGQKLIATGAADSNDPNMQRLFSGNSIARAGSISTKRGCRKASEMRMAVLGTWTIHYTWFDERGRVAPGSGNRNGGFHQIWGFD